MVIREVLGLIFHPDNVLTWDGVLIPQHPPKPDGIVLGEAADADALARQVRRRGDSGSLVDDNLAVREEAAGKNGYGGEVLSAIHRLQVGREGLLPDVIDGCGGHGSEHRCWRNVRRVAGWLGLAAIPGRYRRIFDLKALDPDTTI